MTNIALAVGFAAVFSSQGVAVDPNDAVLQNALVTMANQSTLFLQLNGSITFKNKSTQIITNLYWNNTTVNNRQTVQVDMESYSNGSLVKRIVADGETIWSYDVLMHSYSATPYGGRPDHVRSEHYVRHLLNLLNASATGNDSYLAKLVKQTFDPAGANYTSWMPGIASYELLPGTQVTDPINPSVVYYPSAVQDYFAYNASPKRTIVFEITQGTTTTPSGPPVSGLENIYFNQMEVVAKNDRLIQWVITPYSNFTFSTTLFVPYSGQVLRGWRVVVGPSPVTQ